MEIEVRKQLKQMADQLEKNLLAITCVNDINIENLSNGNLVVDLQHTAYLLDHLLEPCMEGMERLRTLINTLQANQS